MMWTDAEVRRLVELYLEHDAVQCSALLNKSVSSVNAKVHRMDVRCVCGHAKLMHAGKRFCFHKNGKGCECKELRLIAYNM